MRTMWELIEGDGPLVATAIHDGHALREEVAKLHEIDEAGRLREEDPFSGRWTDIADTRIIGTVSRFEMDLNRPREKAVYIKPEDAWGLHVWKSEPPEDLVEQSLRQYDAFYAMADEVLSKIAKRHGKFIVLDLHTYNHRREGPDAPPANPDENPEINVGTGSMERDRWEPVINRFITDLSAFDFDGRRLDVRENIRFRGGYFSKWIHQRFPQSGCALAIEVKKFFMDELSGTLHPDIFQSVHKALRSTVPGLLEELKKIGSLR